jgi:hypothetical protein
MPNSFWRPPSPIDLDDAVRQLGKTNPTFVNEISERVSCLGALHGNGGIFTKRTNLAFHNEINDASPSSRSAYLLRHSGGTNPILPRPD